MQRDLRENWLRAPAESQFFDSISGIDVLWKEAAQIHTEATGRTQRAIPCKIKASRAHLLENRIYYQLTRRENKNGGCQGSFTTDIHRRNAHLDLLKGRSGFEIRFFTAIMSGLAIFLLALDFAWKSLSQREEILAVTAAYAAVMAAFVGISGPREDTSVGKGRERHTKSRYPFSRGGWNVPRIQKRVRSPSSNKNTNEIVFLICGLGSSARCHLSTYIPQPLSHPSPLKPPKPQPNINSKVTLVTQLFSSPTSPKTQGFPSKNKHPPTSALFLSFSRFSSRIYFFPRKSST